MADTKGSALNLRGTPDRANDYFYVWNGTSPYRSTINNELGITGTPIGTSDIQTLTNKTLTAPTLSAPVINGTITGTYTLGGTVTLPATAATLTGTQVLTNKTLTSPTINTPTITNASITQDAVVGFTTANSGTIYGMTVTNGVLPNSSLPSGTVVQIQSTVSSAVNSGSTLIPYDDTVPQITEGNEYMTLSITPKSSTNRLYIEARVSFTNSVTNDNTAALFQDATANALAASGVTATAGFAATYLVTHDMVAGTTSSTTFRIRAGGNAAGTTTFNGVGAARRYGGVTLSTIRITEYKP